MNPHSGLAWSGMGVFVNWEVEEVFAYHVVTDRPMYVGQQIVFDDEHHSGVRVAYIQMLKDILPSSDYIIDGTKELEEKVEEIKKIMLSI